MSHNHNKTPHLRSVQGPLLLKDHWHSPVDCEHQLSLLLRIQLHQSTTACSTLPWHPPNWCSHHYILFLPNFTKSLPCKTNLVPCKRGLKTSAPIPPKQRVRSEDSSPYCVNLYRWRTKQLQLFWIMDSWHGRLGVRFLQVLTSSVLQLCPILLVDFSLVEYHFFSDPGPRNDRCPGDNLLEKIETRLALRSQALSWDQHEMSLNIDMKMIRPVNSSGCLLILDRYSWTLLQSCNVVNPGKTFHSNYFGSPSSVSKALYCGELLKHVNLSSQTVFDGGFSFIFPKHNTEVEKKRKPSRARDWWHLHHQPQDKYFNEESSQLIVFTPLISSDCSTINFSDMSNICFIVRSFPVFLTACKLLSE